MGKLICFVALFAEIYFEYWVLRDSNDDKWMRWAKKGQKC